MPQVGGGAALVDENEDLSDDEDILPPGEGPEEPVEPPEGGEGDDPPEEQPELTTEERARAMGWKPFSEYRGDPRKWRPAPEFVAISEREMPILRDQNRRLQEKVVRMGGEITSLRSEFQKTSGEQLQALRDMREMARKADERGYQRARKDLEEEQRQAIRQGDEVAYDQIAERLAELDNNRPPDKADPPPAPAAPARVANEVQDFISRPEIASWWDTDKQLTQSMLACHVVVQQKWPSMPLADQLEQAFARLKLEYPERFEGGEEAPEPMPSPPPRAEAPRRPAAAPVARPSAMPARAPRQQSRWEEITDARERADVRAQFNRQVAADPGLTEDEFLDIYLDPHADVLTVQAKRRKK